MKKNIFITILLLISQLGFSQAKKVVAPTQKIGYVYEDYILQNLNEIKSLQAEVASKKVSIDTKLEQKARTYQEQYANYQAMMKNIVGLTTDSLNAKLKLVQNLKKDAEEFQANAQQELQKMIQEKFNAIREKIGVAIKAVAAEKGYKIIFRRNVDAANNESNTVMLYSADEGKDDISEAVLIKLGTIPPKK
jgi:Skp family chaperone for outer membrane proteins